MYIKSIKHNLNLSLDLDLRSLSQEIPSLSLSLSLDLSLSVCLEPRHRMAIMATQYCEFLTSFRQVFVKLIRTPMI